MADKTFGDIHRGDFGVDSIHEAAIISLKQHIQHGTLGAHHAGRAG